MKITSVGLHSNGVEVVRFELRKEDAHSRYMVRSIVGLDSDEITPRFYGFGASGQRFYDFAMPARDVVLLVVLNPTFALNEEYSSVRDELYKAISSSRSGEIELRFYSGGAVIARLTGFFVRLEAGYFNKAPEAQLTIRCSDPMFRGINPTKLSPDDISDTSPILIADSTSSAPHGFAMELDFTDTVTTFSMGCPDGQWNFEVTPTVPFAAGDKLIFSSEQAKKKLCVIRDGDTEAEHLMNAIHTGSLWPIMFPGRNEFLVPTIDDLDWVEIEFYPSFWGV